MHHCKKKNGAVQEIFTALHQISQKPTYFSEKHCFEGFTTVVYLTKLAIIKKKPIKNHPKVVLIVLGGRGGIRTRGRLLTYARFPGV
jgi:hypothetical protein